MYPLVSVLDVCSAASGATKTLNNWIGVSFIGEAAVKLRRIGCISLRYTIYYIYASFYACRARGGPAERFRLLLINTAVRE